jgi:hypothetical protein
MGNAGIRLNNTRVMFTLINLSKNPPEVISIICRRSGEPKEMVR